MSWQGIKSFVLAAFSENGVPSSSRVISAWLSVSSMACIWWMVRHAMNLQDPVKIGTWVSGLPQIILALAAFASAPYGLNQMKNAVASLRGAMKGKDEDAA